MSKGMKWFIGIVIGLVVVAILVGGGLLAYSRVNDSGFSPEVRFEYGMRRGELWHDAPMRLPARLFPRFYTGFFPGGLLFGGMVCLGVVGLLIAGVFALAYNLGKRKQAELSAKPAVSPPADAPPVEAQPMAAPPTDAPPQE